MRSNDATTTSDSSNQSNPSQDPPKDPPKDPSKDLKLDSSIDSSLTISNNSHNNSHNKNVNNSNNNKISNNNSIQTNRLRLPLSSLRTTSVDSKSSSDSVQSNDLHQNQITHPNQTNLQRRQSLSDIHIGFNRTRAPSLAAIQERLTRMKPDLVQSLTNNLNNLNLNNLNNSSPNNKNQMEHAKSKSIPTLNSSSSDSASTSNLTLNQVNQQAHSSNQSTQINPQLNPINPQLNQTNPHSNQINPQLNSTNPHSNQIKPQLNSINPHSHQINPHSNQIDPQINQANPHSNPINPQINQTNPHSNPINPQLNQTNPHSNPINPQLNQTNPHSNQNLISAASSPSNKFHPLQHSWTAFYDSKASKRVPNNHSTTGGQAYEAGLVTIGIFATVEDFCGFYNWAIRPINMEMNSTIHMFKSSIRPMWEDPANAKGGKWTLTIKAISNLVLLDKLWTYLVLGLVGEQIDINDDICGAVVATRPRGNRIQIWIRDKENVEKINGLGKRLINLLEINENTGVSVEFSPHSGGFHGTSKFISLQPQSTNPHPQNRSILNPSLSSQSRSTLDNLVASHTGPNRLNDEKDLSQNLMRRSASLEINQLQNRPNLAIHQSHLLNHGSLNQTNNLASSGPFINPSNRPGQIRVNQFNSNDPPIQNGVWRPSNGPPGSLPRAGGLAGLPPMMANFNNPNRRPQSMNNVGNLGSINLPNQNMSLIHPNPTTSLNPNPINLTSKNQSTNLNLNLNPNDKVPIQTDEINSNGNKHQRNNSTNTLIGILSK
ncbi:hypothetical protein O181_003552 [Austropuccinia psidii MF-1]|uniref:Uncharacterized protein n=1 Tax=Austropuccinia psidii MF-1 TaxID=1389203 RepID=A0A9Q3BEK8_9BASI|nr:hypothetical protein [Austropuccinia psidii MF-1]